MKHRPAPGLGAAVLTLVLLNGAPSAAASTDTATAGPQLGTSVSQDADHEMDDDLHDHTGGDVAEWPDWATDEHGDHTDHTDHTDHSEHAEHAEHADEGDHADHGTETEGPHADHGSQTEPGSEPPRALVVGSFAAVNAGVLLVAAFWRRRTRSEHQRRKAARAAALRATARRTPPTDA